MVPKKDDGSIYLDTLTLHSKEMTSFYNQFKVVARWLLFQMHITNRKMNRLEASIEAKRIFFDRMTGHRDKLTWEVV